MANNLRNKWLTLFCVIIIITCLLWAFEWFTKHRKDEQNAYACQHKLWYDLPDLQFKNYDYRPNETQPAVVIKRNSRLLHNVLGLKKTVVNNSHSYQLIAISNDSHLINKNDTILINVGNKNYIICGFKSNSFYIDHHILDCNELYQLNYKTFRINEPNHIDVQQ